ncbi:MAG: MarR family transcriptional regulator [Dehalococcoidia bacterium]|nr:MarR family transcriptional regulator [Dehalococcoidia bacterium]
MQNPDEAVNMLFSIIRAFDALGRYLRIELEKDNINPIQFAIMNALYVHGGRMTPTDISKWVFRSKHTITSDIYTLKKAGYVRREAGKDYRSAWIVITQKGQEKTNEIMPHVQELSWRALSCFDEERRNTFMSLQRQLRKHLDEQIVNLQTTRAQGG